MRWRTKDGLYDGQQRTLYKFAWWPTKVDEGKGRVWLEKYKEIQVWSPSDSEIICAYIRREPLPCVDFVWRTKSKTVLPKVTN